MLRAKRWGYTGAVKILLAVGLAGLVCGQTKQYECQRATSTLKIDGRLDDAAWKKAAWTDAFVDIANDKKPRFRTRVKMLWDDEYLYIGAELERAGCLGYADGTRFGDFS